MLTTLFVDFNSYFASVEQHLRPELRGRPIAVAAVTSDSGCCIAASYEAKKFGVKTGTRVYEAKRLCPEIEIVDAQHRVYVEYHHRLVAAVDSVLPVQAVHSIDEMSCRLGRGQKEPEQATGLALAVKRAIGERVGDSLRCSIGVAPNRFLAKVATDMQKPDGLVVIQKHELPQRLYGLKLDDLPGIGKKMLVRLNRERVWTIEDLCARSERELEGAWESVVGRRWYQWLRGEDLEEFPTRKRSIGHQHVLSPHRRDDESARAIAIRLLHKAAARMREMGYLAGRLTLSVRYEKPKAGSSRSGAAPESLLVDPSARSRRATTEPPPGAARGSSGGLFVGVPDEEPGWKRSHWHASIGLQGGRQDTLEFVGLLNQLWAQRPRTAARAQLVDVTFSELIAEDQATVPLFAGERQRGELAKAMDRINQKYGKNTVYSGAIHDVKVSARGGIAFGTIPDLGTADGLG